MRFRLVTSFQLLSGLAVSGIFEITEGMSVVAQGRVKLCDDDKMTNIEPPAREDNLRLSEAEFFKEMRLRGYNHKDLFRTITECRYDGMDAQIKWKNNWMAFLDCLLQVQVLMRDTRMLVLPTKFRKMIINPKVQRQLLSQSPEELIRCVVCPFQRIIRAGGAEIHDFEGIAVNRRRPIDPILEIYKFVPHSPEHSMTQIDIAKICAQLLLENTQTSRVLTVEVDANDGKSPLSESIFQAVSDLPLVAADTNYLTKSNLEMSKVNVADKDLSEFNEVNIIIKSQCLDDLDFLEAAKSRMHSSGFIIAREPKGKAVPSTLPDGFQLIASIYHEDEQIILLQLKLNELLNPDKIIRITRNPEDWLEPLKQAVTSGSTLIYSQGDVTSGILGLYNCLKRELSTSSKVTCMFIDDDSAPPFDVNLPFYKTQIQQGLAVNVLRGGNWGTFRHLKFTEDNTFEPRKNHVYVDCLIKGDMSTLHWLEGNIRSEAKKADAKTVQVKCSALNFRDVMQSSGKIQFSHLNRLQQQILLGHEFAGIKDGKRVMGLCERGAFSNYFNDGDSEMWEIPDEWTMEEATTVPLCYVTVFTAFFIKTQIKAGESVLIHAGSGGVGLAALHIVFHYGLEVFTTVSSQEKRDFLLKEFPKLKPENIGNSRDTSFEQMIHINTKGKGVNYVLNSLSKDKLLASLRCLTEKGAFLEIGKFDIMNKSKIDLSFLAKEISIQAIFIDTIEGKVKDVSRFPSLVVTFRSLNFSSRNSVKSSFTT